MMLLTIWLKKLENFVIKKQITSFILVGILNTLVGYTLYVIFIYIGFDYTLSVLFATILGVLFNFKTIGKFVFKNSNNTKILKFFLVYGIVFIVNVSVIKLFKLYNFNDYISGLIAIFPASIVSFVLNKYYVFKEKNHEIN